MTFGTKEGRSEVLYTLVGTATIMTIIEIAAAYLLVFPETAMAIDLGLKSLPKTATTYNIERIGLIEARQIIATARAREKQPHRRRQQAQLLRRLAGDYARPFTARAALQLLRAPPATDSLHVAAVAGGVPHRCAGSVSGPLLHF